MADIAKKRDPEKWAQAKALRRRLGGSINNLFKNNNI